MFVPPAVGSAPHVLAVKRLEYQSFHPASSAVSDALPTPLCHHLPPVIASSSLSSAAAAAPSTTLEFTDQRNAKPTLDNQQITATVSF